MPRRRLKLKYSRIPNSDMSDLRRCLKQARICLGYSPTQLADAIGIARGTLVRLERSLGRSLYRLDYSTSLRLVAFCKRPLPPRSTTGLKVAMRELDWVVARLATAYGWEEYNRDLRRRPKPTPPAAANVEPAHHLFVLDDMADYDDPALRTPNQVKCDDLLSHIRLNSDPGDLAYVEIEKREALRDAIRQVRDKLDLTQDLMREDHGVSRATLSRLENLDHKGTTLPSRTTCLKLAAICHREGRTEEKKEAGVALDSEWHRLAAILEDAATWERRNKFAPRGKNRRYRY